MMRCYIIGDPVSHSFSPYLHNKVYQQLGIGNEFEYSAVRVQPSELEKAVADMRAADVRGVSVTIPHKMSVMQYLDVVDPLAEQIGAVNTIVNENGVLHGYNTDAEGVIGPILQRTRTTTLSGKKVLLIGAGGAARAAAFAFQKAGIEVLVIANRTTEKAREITDALAAEIEKHVVTLQNAQVDDFDIIFNATSVGMGAKDNQDTPLPDVQFNSSQIVFDAVYVPHETQLLKDAKRDGATVIHGIEMLGTQAIGQIQHFTGRSVSIETVTDILKEKI